MDAKDLGKMAAVAASAATGRYVGAVAHLIKDRKLIIGVILSALLAFVVLAAVLVSMPAIIMQSMLPGVDKNTALIVFAENEITAAETEKKGIIASLLDAISEKDSDGKVITAGKIVGNEPDNEQILMLYSVKYGEYQEEKALDRKRMGEITNMFFEMDGFKLIVKPFGEVVENLGLTKEQKIIAVNMYNSYMYGQTVAGGKGVDIGGFTDFGDVVYKNGSTDVVYYNQRDKRWNSLPYGDGTIGGAGCGPTSMAMVISTFKESVTPVEMCDWAYKEGYKCPGSGSYWKLIPDCAKAFGLTATGDVTEKQQLVDALSDGKLVVVIMGPGNFTGGGHFLVLRGITDSGKVLVADSASSKRTAKAWNMDIIINEAKRGSEAGGPFWIIS